MSDETSPVEPTPPVPEPAPAAPPLVAAIAPDAEGYVLVRFRRLDATVALPIVTVGATVVDWKPDDGLPDPLARWWQNGSVHNMLDLDARALVNLGLGHTIDGPALPWLVRRP